MAVHAVHAEHRRLGYPPAPERICELWAEAERKAYGADRRPRRSGGDGEPYLAVAAVGGLKHLVPLAIIPSWCGARSTGAAMRHLPLDRHSGGITWLTSIR